jgi:DNA-binding MarR family transcriptional regulator
MIRLARRLRSQSANQTVTGIQLSALDTLSRRGEMTAGELAAIERIQPPSMTRVIMALETAGLVGRQIHDTDRRRAVIAITPTGRSLLAAQTSARDQWLDARLAELGDEDRTTLAQAVEILNKVVAA